MDHRRVLVLLGLLAVSGLALAAQGGPVYTAVPTYPVAGGTCTTGRVQVQANNGAQWCCVASRWQGCGGANADPSAVTTFVGPIYASTTAASTFVGPLEGRDILGCADVRAFGAVGNGVADDTAAIQAAIDSFGARGGPVCLPKGTYKTTATLTMKDGSALIGSGKTHNASDPIQTFIDASYLTTVPAVLFPNTAFGARVENLALKGTNTPQAVSSFGIHLKGSAVQVKSVYTNGFRTGLFLDGVMSGVVVDSSFDRAGYQAVYVYASSGITFHRSVFANAGIIGSNYLAQNVAIETSSKIMFTDCFVDESFGLNQVSFYANNVEDISFNGGTILAGSLGYGVQLTSTSKRVTLQNVRLRPFDLANAPVYLLDIAGTGHQFINIVTETGAGGDINEPDATDSTWFNVNGKFKLPTLPSSYPGTGSKQIWYDPSAATTNVLRFAP